MVKSFTRVQDNAVVLFWSSSGKIKFKFGEQVDYLTTEYLLYYYLLFYFITAWTVGFHSTFYRVFQKFVPIESCTLYETFYVSLGKIQLGQMINLSN